MTRPLSRGERWTAAAIFVVLILALSWNQPRVPAPWVDEGQHLAAAATLVRHGVYGTLNAGKVIAFDPAVQVGPPLILPIAAAFALAGVGEGPARAVCVLAAMATAWLFWRAVRHLLVPRRALLALTLLAAGGGEAFASFAFLGRQALGEVPAIGWLLATFLLMNGRPGALSAARLVSAGLCLGAAVLTKGQLLFVAVPALALVWVADRVYYRQRPVHELPVAIAIALTVVALWHGVQRYALGAEAYAANAGVMRAGLLIQILAVDAAHMRNAVGALWRCGFGWWGGLALLGVWWRVRHRTRDGYVHAWLAAVAIAALVWFVGLSVGWARYASYAAILLPIWTSDAVGALVERLARHVRPRVAWLGAAALLGAAVTLQARQWGPQVLWPADTGLAAMRAVLAREVPDGAMVETWEWEFLIDERVRYSHPDVAVMYEVTRPIMRHETDVPTGYEPLWAAPRFVLQGPYGGWTGIYDRLLSGPGVRKVALAGRYALYEIVDIDAARSHLR